jgi:hypothetical protein
MAFKTAVKSQAKLRAALFGPSGAGKTFSALAIASGMGSRIALIDSERSSASKYADRFAFDTRDLEEKNIDEYVAAIAEAGAAGYEVLIIDSLSHAWQELLADIDALAKAKYKGNTWSAWSEGTPKQHKLVDAILSYPGHVLATMRSKTEWETVKDERTGKSTPVRVGLAPEQGKGIEYEFDLLLELSTEHIGNVIKDRTGKFQDKLIDKPGKEFGSRLVAWLNEGAPAAPRPAPKPAPEDRSAKMAALDEEFVEVMTSSVGAVATFDEAAKEEARAKRKPISRQRASAEDLSALEALVQEYSSRRDALRMAWEAAGCPTPRPAVLKPQDEPSEAPAAPQAKPGPESELSPAAQKVAALAGVEIPSVEEERAPETVGVGDGEELSLF